jgi:hypothetical protein
MKLLSFVILSFLLINPLHGQSAYKSFCDLSGPEKNWVIFHLFVAGKVRKLTNEARITASDMLKDSLLDGDGNGGQIDAFRHSYWMALLSQKIKPRKALALGKAHEKGNFKSFKKGNYDEENSLPDSSLCEMDLFNNKIGSEIGYQNRSLQKDSLKILIRSAILNGQMKIISKNKAGAPLDCNGNLIDLGNYTGKWNIPKCVVGSDQKPR